MKRLGIIPSILLALPIAASAASVPEVEPRAETGTYTIAFHVDLASSLPSSSLLLCRAAITPRTPFSRFNQSVFPTRSGVATITGSTATCWIEIPVAWTQNDAPNREAALNYELEAVSNSAITRRASTAQAIHIAYPAAGGSTRLNINVTF
jgi:hypothetical protein